MVQAEQISKRFGDYLAVDQVSFKVNEGETFAIIGGSGSGKTTVLRLINRLIDLDSGHIHINGKNIMDFSPVKLRRMLGYVIQSIGLFPHYTVAENIAIVPKLLDWNAADIKSRSEELLQMLGMAPGDYMERYPHELSGGQQQRIGIARALAANPPIVLMDEPFGALDPITRTDIQKEFSNLKTKLQQTVVWVTHDIRSAFQLSDKIALMHKGKCIQVGTPKELLLKPANEYAASFLATTKKELKLSLLTINDLKPHMEGKILPFKDSRQQKVELSWDTPLDSLVNSTIDSGHKIVLKSATGEALETSLESLMSTYFANRNAIENE